MRRQKRRHSHKNGTEQLTSPPARMSQAVPTSVSSPGQAVNGMAGRWFSSRNRGWLMGLLLVAATIIAYQPAWHGGFIWDDDSHITANEALRSGSGLCDIWFKPGATCQYYPLSFTIFWADYHLWGLNPLGYHLQNLLLHGLVAVLLWQVLKRLKVQAAWLAGAIFALHPVNVMSVAWMTELKNTLSGALVLGAAWAYLRFAELGVYETKTRPGKDWRYGLLALALFQLAMFAKTAVSFLPLTLLLLVWWKRGRIAWRWVWPVPVMLGIAVGMGLVTLHVEHLTGATGNDFQMNLPERVLVSGRSFWFYLGKLFFPYHLTFIYERWKIDAGAWWQYVYPAATLGLLAGLWWLRRRLGKGLLVALLHFYIATSLLVLIQVLYMMRYAFVSDHWQYFGCMSVVALAAVGIDRALEFVTCGWLPLKRAFCGALLLTLGVLTWRQCGMYDNVETLWRVTIARNPGCFMAHNNLGTALLQKGLVDEAVTQLQEALAINPDDKYVHNNLGNALRQKGMVDDGVVHLRKALAINPDFADAHYNLGTALLQKGLVDEAIAQLRKALAINPNPADADDNLSPAIIADACNNLGTALLQKGLVDEAIVQLRKALEINPHFADAHDNLGTALLQKGLVDDGIAQLRKALEINPDHVNVHYNLGRALLQKGQIDEAIVHFQKVLEIRPGDAYACHNLSRVAWMLATSPASAVRNGPKAVALAEQANRLSGGQDPMIVDTLAAAYAESGRFPEAIATAERAQQLAAQQDNAAWAEVLGKQVKLYRAGTPFRDTSASTVSTSPAAP